MILEGSLRGRVIRSFGADSFGQFLNVGIRLMLIPLFLKNWGAEAYGEWLVLTAVAAWFGLSDLGGQLYFINRLTAEWAAGRIDEFQKVLSTGLLLFIVSSSVLFGLALLVLPALPIASLLELQIVDHSLAKNILLLMALRFVVALPAGLFLGVYRAIGIQATSVMYGNLMLMIQFVASAVALMVGAGMLLLAALEIVPFALVFVVVIFDLRRRLPKEVRLCALGKSDRSILFSSMSPSLHFLGLQFAQAIMIQGSILVVAKTLGPLEVAVFSSMRTVSNIVSQFMGVLTHSVWPEITRLASLGKNEKLTKIFRIILELALFVGLCYLLIIINFGETLYMWWLNSGLAYDFWVMYLLSCQVAVTVLWTWGGSLLMATNRHEEYARYQFQVNLFALFLCYWGAIKFGLLGAVGGLFVGQSLPMLWIVVHLLAKKGWRQAARDLLVIALIGVVLLPATLNIWSGLLSVLSLLALLVARNKSAISNFREMWTS